MNIEKLATEFYQTLFAKYPQVKSMFPTDMKELGIKLMSVFELVIYSFEEKKVDQFSLQDVLIKPMQELGKQHEAKGVVPDHYIIANGLLIETMSSQNKKLFTDEMIDSWKLALEHLTKAMLAREKATTRSYSVSSLRDTFQTIMKSVIKK
jgi:hemoglobin-like flavoprotein